MAELSSNPAEANALAESNLTLSVVIPTYERESELEDCLASILQQYELPREVLLVDDSETECVQRIYTRRREEFAGAGVALRYLRTGRSPSLTIARNMGVEQSIGEIVLFLDDDVVLHRDFILELMNTYRARNEAKGVQGWWLHSFMPGLSFLAQNAFYKAFWLFSYSSGTCDVLHDFAQTYPLRLSRDTKCQWMSGCNQSYRRSILVEFKFDENLRSYAFGEDLDLSLRVTRKYPGSLIITPRAKLRHLAWNAPPNLSREKMLMHFVYPRYLLYKLAPDNAKTYFLFAWSELGRLLLLGFMIGGDRLTNLRNAIDSFKLCRRHLRELREQRIDFFDTWFEPERATRSNRWGVDASRR